MSNTAKDVIDIAKKYVGTTNGDQFVDRYNKIAGAALPHGCFWCACFVSSIMDMAGVPQDSVKAYKGCATGVKWFTEKNRFKSRQSGCIPKPGDIIFFEWQPWNEGTSADDGADHTGIVESVSGGYVHTIEGNSGNQGTCKRNSYAINYSCIEGYGVPLYNVDKGCIIKAERNKNIRAAATTKSKTVGKLKKNETTKITEISTNQKWGKTSAGWISLSGTKKVEEFEQYNVRVTAAVGLNYRSGPGTGFALKGAYPCGTILTIIDEADGWGETSDSCWVCLDYITKI
ncbi:MAG: CHAP domain-containing protein [Selenomonadaceae bacterium]